MAEEKTVRETLEAAYDAAEARAAEPAPTPRPDVARETEPEPERQPELQPPARDLPRDQFGRFSRSSPEGKPPEAAEPAPPVFPDQPETREPEPAVATPAIRAPESWSAAAKDTFHSLPRLAQDEILRRESDMQRGLQQRAEQINALEPLARAIAPYAQKYAIRGIPLAQRAEQLFAIEDYLDRDPLGALAFVARSYGVDLRQYATAMQQQVQQNQSQDPHVNQLTQRLDAYERREQQAQQAYQQAEMGRIQSEVDAFRADTAAHPHFEAVRPTMAQLMERGICATLQDAYEQACWASPAVRQQMLDARQRTDAQSRARFEKEAADRARRAGVSVSGSPSGAGSSARNGKLSRRDAIAAAYEQVVSR